MEVTVYMIPQNNPPTPNHAWLVDAPQLLAFSFGATKEAARQEMMEIALEHLALYYRQGRFTQEQVREIRFVEVETQLTSKELAALTPEWWREARRKTNQEVAAE